ncbi:MAG: 50S ribosomal protein L15 [Candidatus Lloydbacteria bacterium RIFCSPLOWO2_01_FULL_50_20]|uniref:Large ribosomal subunit protein uL15 n=1 Tax=Candidatus Lloydbacteria bacterium RIFCSPLOWO2_01_FULL_50_20 TaxID=1798665 RepID=A0A1G2DCD8_9BACT|nr:MAG: 50S ribosomal protein L15 [Candidatus Lloydbacteria bacterium RIFCSPHIGHO2_02_FULL_50_11]OGZ11284.1 MAG: 50S ribosomal protein L15 [Candidatus Lloydbacteria bacterium RIFCSPLOWO2_01_FULL_50_20]
MQLHQLKRAHAHRKTKRVARGGKRGKTAGRGTKGQKARAGHRLRPELRDIIKKYPKHRGYRFKSIETKPTPINLDLIEATFGDGDAVNPESLLAKKLIKKDGGRMRKVKILGTGKLSKKITLSGCLVSASAKAAIEASGGTIVSK